MRTLTAALVVTFIAAFSTQAHAIALPIPRMPSFDVPRLNLAQDVVDIAFDLPIQTATPSLVVPPRYGWILDDGRAFWFSAGASSVVALGSHVLLGLPSIFVGGTIAATTMRTSPAVQMPFLIGVGGAYLLVESALAALAATLVFNATSKVYDGNYVVSLAAHVGGALLGAGVSALTFGVGALTFFGLTGLVEFTGSAGVISIEVFTFLGALPAIVIGGIALVGVPALVSSWALAVSATTKDGYSINPAWKEPLPETSSLSSAPSPRSATAFPLLTIPLPG